MRRLILGVEPSGVFLLERVARFELGEVELTIVTTTEELMSKLHELSEPTDLVASVGIMGAGSAIGESRMMQLIASEQSAVCSPSLEDLMRRQEARDESMDGTREAQVLSFMVNTMKKEVKNLGRVIVFTNTGKRLPVEHLKLPQACEIIYVPVGGLGAWRQIFRTLRA